MKVLSVVGARPQFIKAAPVSLALARAGIEEVMIHTGQHYDASMSERFFEELQIPQPIFNLGVGSGTHAAQTARILEGTADLVQSESPDWVLVYGDTNSTLGAALAAAKLGVAVAHVEAGLRSFDRSMPEELNRVVTDHLSSVLFAPTNTAVVNLRAEGVSGEIIETGDVMIDALEHVLGTDRGHSEIAQRLGLGPKGYYLATLHRAATTDDPERLQGAIELLGGVGLPVVFPVHPRTRAALARAGTLFRDDLPANLILVDPLGYREMLLLMLHAAAVLTDSGGLQKEAYQVGTRCLTLRSNTEWVETVELGWNTLVDLDLTAARNVLGTPLPTFHPPLYGTGDAARGIALRLATPSASR